MVDGRVAPNPQIALFQLWQKFEAEQAGERDGQEHQPHGAGHHDLAVRQRPFQHRHVEPVEELDDPRFGFVDVRRQDDRTQGRRHGEGGEQAAGQRIGIGARHRAKDVALDAAQREQRDERGDDDGGGKEDRARDVGGGGEDGVALDVHRRLIGDVALFIRRQRRRLRQPPEDRFHHDHGAVHDQSEIDRADRQQVRGLRRASQG